MDIEGTNRASGRWFKSAVVGAFAAILLSASLPSQAAAQTADTPAGRSLTAAVTGSAGRLGRKVSPPQVLSEADASAYRAIFKAQDRGDWQAADAHIERLQDRTLLGHVLAQRHLHPAYPSRFEDLKAWMADHADHPQADRIHALARQKSAKADSGLRPPARAGAGPAPVHLGDDGAHWESQAVESQRRLSKADRRALAKLKTRFRKLLRSGAYAEATALLGGPEARRLLDPLDEDGLRLALAATYAAEGNDALALRWGVPAADRSGDRLPQAHWVAGLSYWRLGKAAEARRHFEAVANAQGSAWMVAAGAYWAARANLVDRRPQVVNHWLEIAAAYPRTFYGLLARRALGQPVSFVWEPAPLTDVDVENLLRVPAGRRALALIQIGRLEDAEEELSALAEDATQPISSAIIALAHAVDLPDVALAAGSSVSRRDGRFHDSAAYPVPRWKPAGGWKIDPALVYAFVRQESSFDPRATSPAGAIGLMQLMPATAKVVAGRAVPRERLMDPAYNLALGQTYLQRLLESEPINGNLLMLAAAYNSGPGNLQRWLQTMRHNDDPLLFLETIPSRETRVFVEKVLANFWIYQLRLGQTTPSLDALAAGEWPVYRPVERKGGARVASARKER